MDKSNPAGIEQYRLEAAKRYYEKLQSEPLQLGTKEPNLVRPDICVPSYLREEIPGLDEYLQKAATAYYGSKTVIKKKRPRLVSRLGHGKPVESLFASLRKERWLRSLAEQKHLQRMTQEAPFIDFVKPCGIPVDVLQRAASKFLLHKQRLKEAMRNSKPFGAVLGRCSDSECVLLPRIRSDCGYAIHIKRCEEVVQQGRNAVLGRNKAAEIIGDTFDDVRRRYQGKPDELYRRKTARRYATWRRKQREQEQFVRESELKAENEMKRRRGHDQLLTSRAAEDSSFVPFLYELSNNTYAYSSKITEAPKLRKIMIDRYTEEDADRDGNPDQWQKAQQAAETKPMFHTRVMNRFS